MLRWIGRKLLFCFVVLTLLHYLNDKHPGWMGTVGEWVGGELGNRFSVTVGDFFDRLEDGNPIREAVEVFREES